MAQQDENKNQITAKEKEASEVVNTEQKPKINNYMNQEEEEKKEGEFKEQVETNPTDKAVEPVVEPVVEPQAKNTEEEGKSNISPVLDDSEKDLDVKTQIQSNGEKQTIGQAKSTQVNNISIKVTKPKNNSTKKKATLGCFGGFGFVALIIGIITYISTGGESGTTSPIAQIFGMEQGQFLGSLIAIINGLFLVATLTAFIYAMVGFLRMATAKKEEKIRKKSGLKKGIFSSIVLLFLVVAWLITFIKLDESRSSLDIIVKEPIVTTPAEPINLTAPIDIRFDASNIKTSRKYKIISYEWNFGDGQKETSSIVAHTYDETGTYNVVLTVTKVDQKTGEEGQDTYKTLVSIAKQALSANIDASVEKGTAPLIVEFDASKSSDPSGEIKKYEWDLNDDGDFEEEGVKIEHTFKKTGKYTIKLRVENLLGDYEVAEKVIDVVKEDKPTATIKVSNNNEDFQIGVDYVFRAEDESAPGGNIMKYEWDFGDGSKVERSRTMSHKYDKEGSFEIILTLTDEDGNEGEVKKKIAIGHPKSAPKADIKASATSGPVPLIVNFDASGSTDPDNNIVEYKWDFDGDGAYDGYGKNISYTYEKNGTYKAMLTVEDADGNDDQASVNISAEEQGIKAVLKTDKIDGNVPLTIAFDASGSTYPGKKITSYTWDFGDGTSPKISGSTITHKFDKIGSFKVTVTVKGEDNLQDSTEVNITVREVPLTACFRSVFYSGHAPFITSFDPSCSQGTVGTYLWDFGDGQTSSEVKPTHTFTDPGEYSVKLEITDLDNTVANIVQKITVLE